MKFEEGRIDDLLKMLGLKPWVVRSRLAVFVEMEQSGAGISIVTTDGPQSDLQRDALLAAADTRGIDTVLPGAAVLAKSTIERGFGMMISTIWSEH